MRRKNFELVIKLRAYLCIALLGRDIYQITLLGNLEEFDNKKLCGTVQEWITKSVPPHKHAKVREAIFDILWALVPPKTQSMMEHHKDSNRCGSVKLPGYTILLMANSMTNLVEKSTTTKPMITTMMRIPVNNSMMMAVRTSHGIGDNQAHQAKKRKTSSKTEALKALYNKGLPQWKS